jgi:hypothetical protein
MLNTLGNKYCPFVLTKLDTPEKQQMGLKYFGVVRNFIIISEEFVFIEQFFIELKDKDLQGDDLIAVNELLEDCVRTCFTLESELPRKWCKWIISLYEDINIDRDEWCNFRFTVIDKLFRKVMNYLRPELVHELYEENIQKLNKILERPCSSETLKTYLLDLQSRKAALLLVELLYANLAQKPGN